MTRLLVLSFDPVTDRMPGPAIRAWHLALELAKQHDVTLAGTAGATRRHPSMTVSAVTGPEVDALVAEADAIVAPSSVVRRHPSATTKPLCIDMSVPSHLENLEPRGPAGPAHVAEVAHQVAVINDDLRSGDFFLCASERQRDFWLGSLASLGRVNPATYGHDASLRSLVAVVPFGVDAAPSPPPDRGILRAAFPVIGPDDPVLVWGGGVYNWFDPGSLLTAVDRLRRDRPALRLVFLGMRHPNPEIPEMRVANDLRRESDRLGLTGTTVLFNDDWIPYDDRGAYLAGADVGVSTHLPHIETRFSFRTRVLDYLWAGLPTVLTEGDTLSEEIAAAGVGMAVPPADPNAVASAIDAMLTDPPDRRAVSGFGARYAWSANCGPLLRYADRPWRAPDRTAATAGSEADEPAVPPVTEEIAHVAGEIGRLTARIGRGAARRIKGRTAP
jgi:glycosyltransferase involved in cell wall biosynthesis